MTAFAIVSFFQIVFIPGFIFLKFFRLKNSSTAGTIIYSFGLSLLINYLTIYHLTLAGIYTPLAAYIILIIELILLICLALKKKLIITGKLYFQLSSDFRSFPKNIIPIISAAAIMGSFYFFFSSYGDVFAHWDAVFSWNRWAIDWYLNDIPYLTYLYPQLIPANWSLSYMLMGSHIFQFAAKSIMPLFASFILITYFSLYLKKKDIAFLISILLFSAMALLYSLPYIDSGYVDFASAFLSIAAFHAILMTDTKNPARKDIIMVFLMGAAAALAKQAGFIILIFSIFWFIWLMVKNRQKLGSKNILINISWTVLILLGGLYWYIIKLVDISMGRDFSSFRFLFHDIHHDAPLIQRFLNGLEGFRVSPVFFLILAGLSLISLLDKKSRWFTLGITIPSILTWGFFFSYDDRNIIGAFPFLAYSASSALMFLFNTGKVKKLNEYLSSRISKLFKQKPELKIKLWPKQVFFLLCFAIVLGVIFTAGALETTIQESQIQKQKQIGDPAINEPLYDYRKDHEIDGKIITDYYWITVLPGFEGSTKRIFFENDDFIILSNSDSYELLDPNTLIDEDTFGFLISDIYFDHYRFRDEFELNIRNGKYTLIFSNGGYRFIRIDH
jgi:hypothetical protein